MVPERKSCLHHLVRLRKLPDDPVGVGFQARLRGDIAANDRSGLDAPGFQMRGQVSAGEGGSFPDAHWNPNPRRLPAGGFFLNVKDLPERLKLLSPPGGVVPTGVQKAFKLRKLHVADRRLELRRPEVVACADEEEARADAGMRAPVSPRIEVLADPAVSP